MAREDHLVTVARLAEELAGESPPVLLDVRWTLLKPDGRDEYVAGHLPGARYVSLEESLSDPEESDPTAGRHPLPRPEQLEQTIQRLGIRGDTPVVAYDDASGFGAARAWWVLRWAGLPSVRVLDGGLAAWREAGLPLETQTPPSPQPSDFALSPGSLPVLDADDVESLAERGTLLDARAGGRFRGESEPMDLKAGHIPGAKNAPATENLSAGRFKQTEELRARYETLGAGDGPVGAYCGSGVTACHDILALAIADIDAALFPASWSGWSQDEDRPVATGP